MLLLILVQFLLSHLELPHLLEEVGGILLSLELLGEGDSEIVQDSLKVQAEQVTACSLKNRQPKKSMTVCVNCT